MSKSEFTPLVSIIIPVFNGANYLRQAIDSALNQDYSNFEVLVINDGSKDNGATQQIAQSYGSRIRYFEKPNGGVATALNLGVEKMKGNYFSWLSHDDLYEKNKLSRQIAALAEIDDSQVRSKTVVYSEWRTIDKDGYPLGNVRLDGIFPAAKLNTPLYALIRGLLHGCAMLVPVDLIRQQGGFDPKLRTTQDYDLWHKILIKSDIRFVPGQLIQSRVHAEQDSKKITTHAPESDDLWGRIYGSLRIEDMIHLEGSEVQFLETFATLLKQAGASRTRLQVLERLTAIAPTNAKAFVLFRNDEDALCDALKPCAVHGTKDVYIYGEVPREIEQMVRKKFPTLNLILLDKHLASDVRLSAVVYRFLRPYLAWIFKRSGLVFVREWGRSYFPRRLNG